MNNNLPSIVYHPLNQIIGRDDLVHISNTIVNLLHKGHITGIVNAFIENTNICVNGVPYIRISGLSAILRTGNSGAERQIIYQGIENVIPPSEIIEIDGKEYISGPMLRAVIDARIAFSDGKTKQYLAFAMQTYEKIINLPQVRDLKELFLDNIKTARPHLKRQRIAEYKITSCEFSGTIFTDYHEVEFAHINSVVTQPARALDITNGVIILKNIHRELTRQGIHDFAGMFKFCMDNNYFRNWAG